MYENIYGVGRKTELLSTVWSYIAVTSLHAMATDSCDKSWLFHFATRSCEFVVIIKFSHRRAHRERGRRSLALKLCRSCCQWIVSQS